jgi:predicted HTH transcriptional regulator
MTEESLRKLLALGEGQTTDFRADYRIEDAGREVCAFLNSGGGCVVFGLDKRSGTVGIPQSIDIVDLETELKGRIVPKSLFSLESHTVEGKPVLVIEVTAGKDIPNSFDNDIFVRSGASVRKADVATILDMITRSHTEAERWERRFSDARLDNECLRLVVRSIQTAERIRLTDSEDPVAVPEDLSLIKFGRLTNAGDLLFCRNTARRYPQVRAKAARFSTGKTDRLEIRNSGELPEGVTVDRLKAGLISVLRKPDIAHVFFLATMTEKWGRGSLLIQKACGDRKLPPPRWTSEKGLGITLTFYAQEATPEVSRLLKVLEGELSRREMQEALGLKDADHMREAYISPALTAGMIEMTIPDSPKQKYRLTPAGKKRKMKDEKKEVFPWINPFSPIHRSSPRRRSCPLPWEGHTRSTSPCSRP